MDSVSKGETLQSLRTFGRLLISITLLTIWAVKPVKDSQASPSLAMQSYLPIIMRDYWPPSPIAFISDRHGYRNVYAAAPKTDAPHGESHRAPNFAGSDPMNRSGSASSTSANPQSTVVVGPPPPPRRPLNRAPRHKPRWSRWPAPFRPWRVLLRRPWRVPLRRERFQRRSVPRWHRRTSSPASCQMSWHRWA